MNVSNEELLRTKALSIVRDIFTKNYDNNSREQILQRRLLFGIGIMNIEGTKAIIDAIHTYYNECSDAFVVELYKKCLDKTLDKAFQDRMIHESVLIIAYELHKEKNENVQFKIIDSKVILKLKSLLDTTSGFCWSTKFWEWVIRVVGNDAYTDLMNEMKKL